jgi:hypothetical protein
VLTATAYFIVAGMRASALLRFAGLAVRGGDRLGLWRAALAQDDRQDDDRRDREEFALPARAVDGTGTSLDLRDHGSN